MKRNFCLVLCLGALSLQAQPTLTNSKNHWPQPSGERIGTGNPYLPLWEHLPDGEPRVFEDPDRPGKFRVYIVGSHDTRFDSYCGADIHEWSAPVENLTDWRDEGAIFTYQTEGKWDVMYAPDLVEINRRDGSRDYYLYPHSRGANREAMVCKGKRPDGPFTPVNLSADGQRTVDGSFLGFDPSVFIEPVTNPADPDYATGFRAYGFWGFMRSSAAQLDPATMYSVRPGTDIISYFIPAPGDPEGTTYPALYKEQNPADFNFFEASSIRQVGNKYVMIFSGHSGPEYGLGSSNSTLRYAFSDTPLGPWRSGGVLVDSRGVVPDENGEHLVASNAAHNTHGSIQCINGQWYVFYHRPPRGFGFARQAMVAPVTLQWDEKSVADGGKVVIRGYDPFATDSIWQSVASDGHRYEGAEVTSEGFQIFGMPPYAYYSAGYACYLSDNGAMQDSWDVWDNHTDVLMKSGDIVGFKYFGFGGLKKAQKGLLPFEGTKKGNGTQLDIFLQPTTESAFSIKVMLDGPWNNATWQGRQIGEFTVPSGSTQTVQRFSLDVAKAVEGLKGKHAIYLVVGKADTDGNLCTLKGLGFSHKDQPLTYPAPPAVSISIDGQRINLPSTPIRSTEENGLTDYGHYEVTASGASGSAAPRVTVEASSPEVTTEIVQQPARRGEDAVIRCSFRGRSKTYTIHTK